MASRGRSNDVECQNNSENLLNQTQEDVTFLDDMTSIHIIRDADFFDLSDPEKRYNFQNEMSHSHLRIIASHLRVTNHNVTESHRRFV